MCGTHCNDRYSALPDIHWVDSQDPRLPYSSSSSRPLVCRFRKMSEATDFGGLSPTQGDSFVDMGWTMIIMSHDLGVGSVDREERKRLRKKRIDKLTFDSSASNAASQVFLHSFQGNHQFWGQDVRSGEQQVIESQGRLDRRKKKGIQDVTEVKLQADAVEAKRRIGRLDRLL